MKKQKTLWAEFYNLNEENSGITFKVTQVSLYGDILRLELPARNKKHEECWHFVRGSPYDGFRIGGKDWTDFGCAAKPSPYFVKIKNPWNLKGLTPQ